MVDSAEKEELQKAASVLIAAGYAVLSLEDFNKLLAVSGTPAAEAAVTREWILEHLAKIRGEIVEEVAARVARQEPEDEAPSAAPSPESRWLSIAEFARTRSYSETTIRAFLLRGMPSRGSGRLRRIPTFPADQWIAKNAGKGGRNV